MINLNRIKNLSRRLFQKRKPQSNRKPLRIAKKLLMASNHLTLEEKNLLKRVSLNVHHSDDMYHGDASHYLSVGLSASLCIEQALCQQDRQSPVKTILDFPCGHGRVLRFLRAKFPDAEITGAEINSNALDFCRSNFAIKTILSNKNFSNVLPNQKFDLIWCGSLITHIDEQATNELLKFFFNHLSDQGLCIFTSHGAYSEKLMKTKNAYGLTDDQRNRLLSNYKTTGFGHSSHQIEFGYGISVISQERVMELASNSGNWNLVMFKERGWDNHQDVYAFERKIKFEN